MKTLVQVAPNPNLAVTVILPGVFQVPRWGQQWILSHPLFVFAALPWHFLSPQLLVFKVHIRRGCSVVLKDWDWGEPYLLLPPRPPHPKLKLCWSLRLKHNYKYHQWSQKDLVLVKLQPQNLTRWPLATMHSTDSTAGFQPLKYGWVNK